MTSTRLPERRLAPIEIATPPRSPGPLSTSSIQTPSTPKLGALHGRIANVLSASYADLDIRDTLETLDARGVHNNPETRRNLRLDLQRELIQCNGEIVKDFGQIAGQLRRIGSAIEDLNKSCAAIRVHVAAAKRESAPILDESSTMLTQKRQTETKQKLLHAFNTHFLLSETELSDLTAPNESVTDSFFEALTRAQKIQTDSQVLLGSEDQHLGLEILEQSSKHVNTGFQKLFRWTQQELKTIDLENPQLSHTVRRALRVLAQRPSLFQNCLDFFAESREHTLSDAFYAALTGTVVSNSSAIAAPSRAIELNAHEPLRYVSDMLAWVHAAAVSEREALQILFVSDADQISKSLKAGHESEPWLHDAEEGAPEAFDGKRALNDLVDRDMSGVVRQLRQRIEQALHNHEDAPLAYQISNVVTFYTSIFSSLLGAESGMEQTLQPVVATAMEQFRSITRDHLTNLYSDVTAAPSDLSPPDFLEEALDSFKGMMKSYDTSLAGAQTAEERIAGFRPVLSEALDPYLSGCESMAKHMDSPDGEIFAINCTVATKAVLKGPSYTAERVEEMDESVKELRNRLVQAVHAWFVTESGMRYFLEKLGPFYDVSSSEELAKAAKLKVLTPEPLQETAQRLDGFLPDAMEDARTFIGRLTDKTLVREICEEAADLFTEDFESVERLLSAIDEIKIVATEAREDDKAEDGPLLLRDLFPRTSEEIKVLLS